MSPALKSPIYWPAEAPESLWEAPSPPLWESRKEGGWYEPEEAEQRGLG